MFAGELTLEKAAKISRWYFIFGFFALPWLWAANVFMFWRYRYDAAGNRIDAIARTVHASAVGFVIACIAFALWYALLYNLAPGSSLWIIRPGGSGNQAGLFSAEVYSNVN